MSTAETQDEENLSPQSDNEYRQFTEQHHRLDHRLHELADQQYRSTSEQLEEVTLKKRKLALKDRMQEIAREHNGHSRAS